MLDKKKFDPEKISLIDFKFIKGQIETPEDFNLGNLEGYNLESTLELAFNIEEELIKADLNIKLESKSKHEQNEPSVGVFHLVYIFKINNFEDMVEIDKGEISNINRDLGIAISSISYSTARGILLTRLQGTAFQNFILPIIDPKKLLNNVL